MSPTERHIARPFIKVCGVRERTVLQAAVEAGASAIGLNFVPGVRRALSAEAALDLLAWARQRFAQLPLIIGVFADAESADVQALRQQVGLDWVQLHGHETAAQVEALAPAYKALRIGTVADLDGLAQYPGPFVLIDARVGHRLGGTGRRIPADLVARAAAQRDVVVAGGLSGDNVADVIAACRPTGVDAASGAEDDAGAPSASAARRYIEAARAAFGRFGQENRNE